MRKRILSFDVIRCCAIVIIVTCHFFLFGGIAHYVDIGKYFGGIGNFLFFAISALLFGLRYKNNGKSAFGTKNFLKKRFIRLFSSLWPFLSIALIFYFAIGVELSPLKVAMNFIGLGWFAKLPNMGHLWFVTMIAICYIMYVIVANRNIVGKLNGGGKNLWLLLFAVCMLLEVLTDIAGLPGYLFMVVFYSLCIFSKADEIMKLATFVDIKWLFIAWIMTNVVAVYTCCNWHSGLLLSLQRLACYIAGFGWLLLLLYYGKNVRSNFGITFLSAISYEIYLVHHVLCLGEFSVLRLTESSFVNYIILWVFSIIFGYFLKHVGDRLNSVLIRLK